MKPATKTRHALLASLLAGSTLVSTGCSSGGFPLASMNPFAKSAPTQVWTGIDRVDRCRQPTVPRINSTRWAPPPRVLGARPPMQWPVSSRAKSSRMKVRPTDPLSLSNTPSKSVGPEVFVANGQLWESTGDFGKAMESYTKALESAAKQRAGVDQHRSIAFPQREFQASDRVFSTSDFAESARCSTAQ